LIGAFWRRGSRRAQPDIRGPQPRCHSSRMDWIEKTLHVSPDGGNGSLELVVYLVLSLAVFVVVTGAARAVARRLGR
jgi:hypothetical protein